jgi:CheY-like chemotaxis protein
MSELNILIVDDGSNWQKALQKILQRLGGEIRIDMASDYSGALIYIQSQRYDLAVVDLALLGNPGEPQHADELGMELLRELRTSRINHWCGIVVLTGYPTETRALQAFRIYRAYDFVEKTRFDEHKFVATARGAILDARYHLAETYLGARYHLVVSLDHRHLIGTGLVGPDRLASYTAERPTPIDVTDLHRRSDNLNYLVLSGGGDLWRPEARSIGQTIYQVLATDQRILAGLTAARALAKRYSDLWVEFRGPANSLGIPFELLRDEDDYLAFEHVLTRSLVRAGSTISRKPEKFHDFLRRHFDRRKRLCVLVVAANTNGHIPAVEEEAATLAVSIRADLQRLGLDHEVTLLSSTEATYTRVTEALHDGQYHLFHYAGHGRFDDQLSEVSGLILRHNSGLRTLTAAELKLLMSDTELRLIYLSCCLGARSAQQTGRGDFQGILEALALADVPIALGYRWTVRDDTALQMAQTFYRTLWRTFSPGQALLEARRSVAMGERGRDDETWASPVLLMQNG